MKFYNTKSNERFLRCLLIVLSIILNNEFSYLKNNSPKLQLKPEKDKEHLETVITNTS